MSSKPKMRNDSFANADLSKALEHVFTEHPFSFTINCFNCEWLNEKGEPRCQKFDMVPPVEVLKVGCEKHKDQLDIPF